MSSDKQKYLPKVSVRDNNGSIQIRFTLHKKKYSLTGLGKYDDSMASAIAEKICSDIKHDLLTGQFDGFLDKYRPVSQLNLIQEFKNQENLDTIWALYKQNHAETKLSVQTTHWNAIDKLLEKINNKHLYPLNRKEFVNECLRHYAPNTLDRLFRYLAAASSEAHKARVIQDNYWGNLYSDLPKLPPNKRAEQYYTSEQVVIILEAFRTDRFVNPNSTKAYKHSYYAPIVEFLFLTGCRPQDAIGLIWGKINPQYILFDEAITRGFRGTNKTEKARKFPINSTLQELIGNLRIDSKDNYSLVFPSINGNPMSLKVLRKNWSTIIYKLIELGELDKYLPPYNLRNSSITLYSQNGVADKDLAKMMGTSTQMIDKHYKGIRDVETMQLPEI